MQKKVLIPLLMAGTATVPALADINIGFPKSGKWTQSGTTGNENPWSQSAGSTSFTYTNVIGTGEVSTSVNLPKGNFRLSFAYTVNIKVFVDGKEVEHIAGDANVYEFAVETAGDIAIVIKPAEENKSFEFGSGDLALVIDGAGIADALEQLQMEIYNIGFNTVEDYPDRDFYKQADDLRIEKDKLQRLADYYKETPYWMVFNDIRSLDNRRLDDETLRIYNGYELYNTPNAPEAALADLAELQQTYNDKVDAENAAWEVYKANKANYEELIAGQKSLLSNDSNSLIDVAQLRAEIDAWQVVDEAVKQPLYEALAAIEAKVVAYGKAIDAAYYVEEDEDGNPVMENVALREAIVFESQEEALRTELANLQAQLKQDVSDYEVYYNVNFLWMDELVKVYENEYRPKLALLEPIDESGKMPDAEVYGHIFTDKDNFTNPTILCEDKAIELVDFTKATYQIENVAGAAEYENTNHCIDKIKAAIKQLRDSKDNFINLVTTQDANKEEAQAQIEAYNERLSTYKGYNVPNDAYQQYKEMLDETGRRIGELTEYVGKEYEKHTLKIGYGSQYYWDCRDLEYMFNQLGELAGPVAIINDLQKMLDDARAKVAQESYKEELVGVVDVASKFDGTFANLQKAINEIKTMEDALAAVQLDGDKYKEGCLADEILKTVANAKAMTAKFLEAQKNIGLLETVGFDVPGQYAYHVYGLDVYKTLVDTKDIVKKDINYGDPTKTRKGVTVPEVENLRNAVDYSYYENDIADFNEKLSEAALAENQMAWQLINQLCKDIKDGAASEYGTFSEYGTLGNAMRAFAKNGSTYNKQYVDRVYQALTDKKEEAKDALVTKIETVNFDDIETAYADLDSNFKKLTNYMQRGMILTNAPLVDNSCIEVLKAIYVQEDKINDLVANQEAFNALTVEAQKLEDEIAAFRGYNETNSLTPAKEHFEEIINELDKRVDALYVKLAKSVEAVTAVADTEEFTTEIAGIRNDINTALQKDIDNNRCHNEQLALEKEVRTYIENLIDKISANKNQEGLDLVTECLDTLNDLLSNDLVTANNQMTNDYGNGWSADNNEAITADYNRIMDKAVAVNDRYVSELQSAVEAANAITTAAWTLYMTELDNLYSDATRTYNYFAFFLENKGWREYVAEEILKHQKPVFENAGYIETLKEREAAAVAAWNKEGHVILEEEWTVWESEYVDTKKALIDDFDYMLDKMNGLAVSYYDQEKAEADAAVAAAEAALTTAGIDTAEYLNDAREYLQEAEFEYWRGSKVDVQSDSDSDVSLAMDNVANVLDQVIPSIDVQANAQDAWAKVYAGALSSIDAMREELEGYDFAATTVVAEQTKVFNDNVSNAAGVNTKAVNDKELVKNFKADCEELQGYLDNMAEAVAAVKESNDLNVENINIYGNFINWSQEAQADIDALREYCEAMAGCFSKMGLIDALQTELEAFKRDVEQNKATLVEEDVPGRMDAFDAKVLATYVEEAAAEKAYLSGQVDEATDAFAEAYRNKGKLTDAQFAELNADIQDIDAAVAALVFDADDKDAFKDEAVKYEKELADIYNMLKSSWTENPATAVVTELEGRYATISASIEAGKTLLANCMDEVKAKYPDAYKAYEDALNAERAAWQSEGTHVIDRKPFHNKALDEIAREVGALTDKIKADEQKAQAEAEKIRVSEARYEVLKAQYDDLVEDFEAAKETVEGYGNNISKNLTSQANRIQGMLDASLKDLDSRRAAHSLTADSQLNNAKAIETEINSYALAGAKQKANIDLNAAKQARSKAMSALTAQNIVPAEKTALEKELNVANSKLNKLLDEENQAGVTRLEEISAEAAALVETFDSIAERAQDSYFIPGNVNMDEDGEVNAVDVQALINLIGEGETYESLYAANPRQACAADVAGNKVLDIADVTALIQLIMGDQPQVLKVRARVPGVTGDDHLTIALMGEENGLRRYALSLTNTTEFIGAQFDIRTSGNARIVGMETAERTAAHEVYMFENIDGARAVIASMENAVFAGNDGVVMYVDVEGKGELTVHHAGFADKDNVTHLLDKAHTSSINAIIDGFKDGASRIYDAAGRAYNRLQKGINIIRHKDGSVTKEMHK